MIGKTRFDHKRASVLTTAVLRALLQVAKTCEIWQNRRIDQSEGRWLCQILNGVIIGAR